MNTANLRDYQMEILSDLTYSRAAFFRRHSGIPNHLMRMYLTNETQMMTLLDRLSRSVVTPPPQQVQAQATSFDIPLTTFLSGLFPNVAGPQFWEAVTVGLTPDQFAAATREYLNTDLAENDQCCICQESIAAEPSIDTMCPGPALGDGVTSVNHHAFHRRCATAWFAISTRCPVCRADLRTLTPTTTNDTAAVPGGEPDPAAPAPGGGVHPNV